jgi:hypothetical protein
METEAPGLDDEEYSENNWSMEVEGRSFRAYGAHETREKAQNIRTTLGFVIPVLLSSEDEYEIGKEAGEAQSASQALSRL